MQFQKLKKNRNTHNDKNFKMQKKIKNSNQYYVMFKVQ